MRFVKRFGAAICVSLSSAVLVGCSSVEIEPAVVQAQVTPTVSLEPYRKTLPIPNAEVLFNPKTNALGGWNHVANFPDEFAGLNFPSGMYRVDRKPALNRGIHLYSTTLIKKYGDWHHQHANGITANFEAIPFSRIEGIELVLKINSDVSSLPTLKEVLKTYEEFVPKKQLEMLDDGQVHLSLALVGSGAENVETPTFNADYLLSLDAKKQVDEWYHVFIPRSELSRSIEQSYNSEAVAEAQAENFQIESFRLMAETASTKVVRNFIPNSFDETTPKLFKEIGLEVQYIGVVKKKVK